MSRPDADYDVLVAGGGPAGSTAATLLARHGHRVLLVERDAEPRFKVGESLMPATYEVFERLDMLDAMRASEFPVKASVQFFTRDGRATAPFYFFENDPSEGARTWQVLREDFDAMLRDNAARHGAEVRTGVAVREVLFDDDRAVGARLDGPDGEELISSRVFVDATGQSALLARRLGLKRDDPALRKVAFFTHFEGAERDCGVDEGATLILHTASGEAWFWFIPLPGDRASVGVVGDVDRLVKGRSASPQEVFEAELADCPALAPRLAEATQAMEMKVIRDFSYRSERLSGDGWVLVGDAYGFIDPIYSTGVFLALKSAEMAADDVHRALEAGDLSAEALGASGGSLRAGMDAMKRLVEAFYDEEFSFSRFLRVYPQRRQDIIDMLVGKVFDRSMEGLLADLDEFQAATLVGKE